MGLPYCRGRVGRKCEKDSGQYDTNAQVDLGKRRLLGGAQNLSLMPWAVLMLPFFMHFEEIDLCLRAQAKGHQVWAIGNSEVYHKGASSLAQDNPRKLHYNIRNSLLTYTKNIAVSVLAVGLCSACCF